jgi:beta-hydroxylase
LGLFDLQNVAEVYCSTFAGKMTATSPNDDGDRTGFLNRVFKYVYAVRRVGKRIKAWHRPTYYVIKWTLFGTTFVGVFYAF